MSDVQRGDIFRPTAEEWNGFRAAAKHAAAAKRSGGDADFRSLPPGVVLVRNEEEVGLPNRAAVHIGEAVVSQDNESVVPFDGFAPCFKATSVGETGAAWGILLQPLAPGKIGRAVVHGTVLAKIIWDPDGGFVAGPKPNGTYAESGIAGSAIIWANADDATLQGEIVWALLSIGADAALAVPAKIKSFDGAVYEVDLYAFGPIGPKTGTGILVLPEVQQFSRLADGTWVLAHSVKAGAERTTEED